MSVSVRVLIIKFGSIRSTDCTALDALVFLSQVLVYPGAFNMTTGPAHYQILARGRAVDTQSYAAWPSTMSPFLFM